jgi:hypothetical protein
MKKLLLGSILLVLAIVVPIPTMAGVDISIGISLPPLITFEAPPDVIVMPDTDDVYVVPGIDVDMFFWNGWWWRPWEGRWYRSHYYNRGWAYYNNVPRFYYDVDPGWRGYYREHNWYGHRWNYERIPNRQLQQNWKSWHNNRQWEKQRTWDVQNYQPRPQQQRQELRQQRQEQYQQRPGVQPYQQQRQQQHQPQVQQPSQRQGQQREQQQRQPQVKQSERQQQPQQQKSQPQGQQNKKQSKDQQPKEQPGKGDEEHRN